MHPRTCLFLTLLLALAACQDTGSEVEVASIVASNLVADSDLPSANVVDVTALDYALDAPMEIPSGWTTFRLTNEGSEPHYFTLSRLKGDHTINDYMQAVREGESLEGIVGWPLGGPNAPARGAASVLTMNLEPGRYVMVCWWPSPDHTAHAMKGMVRPLTVTEEPSSDEEPSADVELVMRDYAFELSGPVRPGPQTIRIRTDSAASETHEIFLARLEPGQSAEELEAWLQGWLEEGKGGEVPEELLSGVAMMGPGESGYLTVDFAPGEYALICPLPAMDGEMHSKKGMITQFTVEEA